MTNYAACHVYLYSREIGPRSKVWCEREMVEKAAYEFAEVWKVFLAFWGCHFCGHVHALFCCLINKFMLTNISTQFEISHLCFSFEMYCVCPKLVLIIV